MALTTAVSVALNAARRRASPGRCPACERRTLFVREGPWLRDQLVCARCRSIPRWRALSLVLDREFPDWPHLQIHEAAPGGAASDRLLRRCRGYSYSFYSAGDGPHEDLEALSFASESLDLVVTQDVFEHVLRPALAFAEIARVLRPGGAHVFTVPMYQRPNTLVRVSPEGDHLLPPEFHEGPEGPSLVVTEWGRDLPERVERDSGLQTSVHRLDEPRFGLAGEFLEVFVSRKKH